jgi:protein arginine kinase activator
MLCDNCHERDSVVQLTKVTESGPSTLHLCEKCAGERGIETSTAHPKDPLTKFLLPVQKQLPAVPAEAGRCTFCSATLRDFRASGRLGCSRCYAMFEASLRDLLRRVHGSSRHVGKRYEPPTVLGSTANGELAELRDRLRRAIDAEQFELAARIRDQIKVLE